MARLPRSAPANILRSPCPVAAALDLLGDRWTLLVVRDLFLGLERYGEFAAGREKIPTNLLADRLARLERAGVVRSTPYQNNPPRYAYALTAKGEALGPVLQELVTWGRRFIPGTKAPARATKNSRAPSSPPRRVKSPPRHDK